MIKVRPPHIPDFNAVAKRLRTAANTTAFRMIRSWAGAEAEAFKKKIQDQDFDAFDAEPLSPGWLARKVAAHADARTMIATGQYVKRISVFVRHDEGKTVIFVGFDADDPAVDLDGKPTRLKLYQVAEIQEHGSEAAGIPPRPHWGPHLNDMRKRAADLRRAIARKAVRVTLGKEGE